MMRPLPPVYFLAAIGMMAILHYQIPVAQWIKSPWNTFGVALILPGLALASYSAMLFHKHGTAIKPFLPATALVSTGPYRYTRNPMYLSMCIILCGVAIGLGTISPWLVIPLFIWMIKSRFISTEEAHLTDLFGATYAEYRRRVRRWL